MTAFFQTCEMEESRSWKKFECFLRGCAAATKCFTCDGGGATAAEEINPWPPPLVLLHRRPIALAMVGGLCCTGSEEVEVDIVAAVVVNDGEDDDGDESNVVHVPVRLLLLFPLVLALFINISAFLAAPPPPPTDLCLESIAATEGSCRGICCCLIC